jgi:transcriptional regulator with XRE-family HTH domain
VQALTNARVRQLRKILGLSQTEFGKKLGVSRSVVLNVELNKVRPKEILIDHACEVFDVNKEWLAEGKGEVFSVNALAGKAFEELWQLYQELNPEYKEYVLKQINQLLELQNSKTNS